MRPITAADLMNPRVLTAPVDMTVPDLAAFLLEHHHRVLVLREGRTVGIISSSDLIGLLVEER